MTADDFTNLVAAEIERRLHCHIEIVELQQMCDCPYGEPDAQERCVECGRKYREVGRG